MNRTEHLLIILSEECSEVSHRISKALRFGLNEIEPGQSFNNSERINQELCDLLGVVDMITREKHIDPIMLADVNKKRDRVEKYLKYSREQGTLTDKNLFIDLLNHIEKEHGEDLSVKLLATFNRFQKSLNYNQ